LGLLNVVYKLLEKVTKCASVTWSKQTNGDPPSSAFCRVPIQEGPSWQSSGLEKNHDL